LVVVAKTLETAKAKLRCERMEQVWDELKKIEAQAQQIRSEAQIRSKQLTDFADQRTDQLIAHAKTYAEQDTTSHYEAAMQEATHKHDTQLEQSKQSVAAVQAQAQNRLNEAVRLVVKAVLGEENVAPNHQVR
jgi:vacuolar-type H+-ATPase subunit H